MAVEWVPCQRFLFDIPEDVAYFNCAYMAPSLKSVRAAGEMGVAAKSNPWMIKPGDFFTESAQLKSLLAELIGCAAENLALVPSVSYGIATAASNLKIGQDQHVLVLEEQFPSNIYAWKARGELRTVPRPSNGHWTPSVIEAMDANTAVVSVPHCHWTDGSMLDLEEIGKICQQRDIPLVLDVTQSLGALPLNLDLVKPSFMVAAAYKWLLGPYSLGFMYVDPKYHNGKPLEENWITRAGSENFGGLIHYTDAYAPGAGRFDMGERSNFALLPMAAAALEQILSWGVDAIQATLRVMTLDIAEKAKALGCVVGDPETHAGHLLGIRFGEKMPPNLAESLAEQNIFVSIRGNSMRISPHLYNHEGDINRLLNVLKWHLK